jgi:polar amino acid transport system substrate-binding protein
MLKVYIIWCCYLLSISEPVQIVGELLDEESYGIGLPAGSPLREDVNRTLLEIIEDGTYNSLYQRWFDGRGT